MDDARLFDERDLRGTRDLIIVGESTPAQSQKKAAFVAGIEAERTESSRSGK